VVGIAACGLTPFVRGAIRRARTIGARTAFITCAPEVAHRIGADIIINPVVGPEIVTGSTRMKAGTATKLVLNTLTTAAMIRIGKVHGNLMVDLRATNAKLRDRAERIVMAETHLARRQARRLLKQARGQAKAAIAMHRCQIGYPEAARRLAACGGSLRQAIEGRPR
jgi:N-acetylmuramic acid 6-phosphate etherase